jgi:hypothetical protein
MEHPNSLEPQVLRLRLRMTILNLGDVFFPLKPTEGLNGAPGRLRYAQNRREIVPKAVKFTII